MKKIAIVTATRAEYGLLRPVICRLREMESDDFRVELIVTGTHLSEKYGNTIKEIEYDGLRIDHCIDISIDSNSEIDISKNQADALVKFTKVFMTNRYSAVILLGDRYETLAIAISAGNTQTPIFHLCGGDTTEGAIDEWIRHSITKMSYLHFVTNADSRRRVIQLGESPDRVFNYGSTSIDNILQTATMSKKEALNSVGLDSSCKYALCTYHPVTMEKNTVEEQMYHFLQAIKSFPELCFIVTKSNADQGGMKINRILDREERNIDNLFVFSSLGVRRYLSLMKYSEFVLGNSSSGIIETPAFKIPTVNIGDRQRGRLQADSIINCQFDAASIIKAIEEVMSYEFKNRCKTTTCLYGEGDSAKKIANKLVEIVLNGDIDLKKKFYNRG